MDAAIMRPYSCRKAWQMQQQRAYRKLRGDMAKGSALVAQAQIVDCQRASSAISTAVLQKAA